MKALRWITTAVCLTILVYSACRVDWAAASATLARASLLPLAAAVIVNGLSLTLRGMRWWIFLRAVGAASLPLAIRGAIVGAGFNNVLVANGGDAARVLLVARASGVPRSAVLATMALERLFDPICFGLLLFGATFVVALPEALVRLRGIAGVGLLIAAALLALLVQSKRAIGDASSGWRGHVQSFRMRVQSLATGKRFVAALLGSVGVWALQVSEFALVANALHLGLSVGGSVAAMLLINTGLILRATPGNVGYFQFAYAVAASRFGVATNAAVAAAILIQLVEIVPVTIAALAFAPGMMRGRCRASCVLA